MIWEVCLEMVSSKELEEEAKLNLNSDLNIYIIMVQFIKDNGEANIDQDTEYKFGLTEQSMKGSG